MPTSRNYPKLEKPVSSTYPEVQESRFSRTLTWIQKKVRNRMSAAIGGAILLHGAAFAMPLLETGDTPPENDRTPLVAKSGLGKQAKLIALLNNPERWKDVPADQLSIIQKLYIRDFEKVEARQAERRKNIIPKKVDDFEAKYQQKMTEAPGSVTFGDFTEEAEKNKMGVDPQKIAEGKAYFQQEMEKLRPFFNKIPFQDFLEKINNLDPSEKQENTSSSVFEYLACKARGEQHCGNCETRMKFKIMAVEYFYPQLKDTVQIQEFGEHIIAAIEINKKIYAFEPGFPELTAQKKAGTFVYPTRRFIKKSLGMPLEPIEPEPGEYEKKPYIPIITDNNGTFRGEGKNGLRLAYKDIRQLYPDFDNVATEIAAEPRNAELLEPESWSEGDVKTHIRNADSATIDATGLINPTPATIQNINKVIDERRSRSEKSVTVEGITMGTIQEDDEIDVNYGNISFYSPDALKAIYEYKSSSAAPIFQIYGRVPDVLLEAMKAAENKVHGTALAFASGSDLPMDQLPQFFVMPGKINFKIDGRALTKDELEKIVQILKQGAEQLNKSFSLEFFGDFSIEKNAIPVLHTFPKNSPVSFFLTAKNYLEILETDPTMIKSGVLANNNLDEITTLPENLRKFYALDFFYKLEKYRDGIMDERDTEKEAIIEKNVSKEELVWAKNFAAEVAK